MSQLMQMNASDADFAASGDNTAIAAVTGRTIKVWQIVLMANAAVNVIFKHGTTAYNGHAWPLVAQGSNITLDHTGQPWWTTAPGEAFVVNLSGAVQMFGRIFYTVE